MNKYSKYILCEISILALILICEIYNTLSKTCFIRIEFIEKLIENLCIILSKFIPRKIYFIDQIFKEDKILIASRLQNGGGLGKILLSLNRLNKSPLVLTNIINFRNNRKESIYLNVFSIRKFGLLQKIFVLQAIFRKKNILDIHILNDPSDPLPFLAYLTQKNRDKNFFFHHHADHSYSFGMFNNNWNHIDYFQNQYLFCRKKCNCTFRNMFEIL